MDKQKGNKKPIIIGLSVALALVLMDIVIVLLLTYNKKPIIGTPFKEEVLNAEDAYMELQTTISSDVNGYLSGYGSINGNQVAIANQSGLEEEVAETSVKYLTVQNANIDAYSNEVNDIVSRQVTGISEEQLRTLVTSIETICITDAYKLICDRQLVDKDSMEALAAGLDGRISSIEKNVRAHSDTLDAQLTEMQERINDFTYGDSAELVKMSNRISTMLRELQEMESSSGGTSSAGTVSATDVKEQLKDLIAEMDASDSDIAKSLLPELQRLSGRDDYDASDLREVLQKTISEIVTVIVTQSNDYSSMSSEIQDLLRRYNESTAQTNTDIESTKLLIETLNNNLQSNIDANKSEAEENDTAISRKIDQNASDADSKLNSLSTDMNQKINAVKNTSESSDKAINDKIDSAIDTTNGRIQSLDTDVNSRINSLKTDYANADDAINERINQTVTSTDERINALDTDVNKRIEDLDTEISTNISSAINTLNTAITDVSDELNAQQGNLQALIDTANADYTSYVQAVENARDNARGLIATDKSDALSAIAADLGTKTTSGALFDIETDRTAALGDIDTAKNSSINAVSAQESSSIAAVQAVQNSYDTAMAAKEATVNAQTQQLSTTVDDINNRIDDIQTSYLQATWSTGADGRKTVSIAPVSTTP